MSLFIASLNSGSNGNCYYVGNRHEAVLVDVGISGTETVKRMLSMGLTMNLVKAIFVSHEHTDHIKGVSSLANKYKLPVYITAATATSLRLINHLSKPFVANQPITIGSLTVVPFSKRHDAADPHSFVISHDGITAGVFTDIGSACTQVTKYFSQCNAAFLEANYDEELLEKGSYPVHLKNRIRSNEGHLSNKQALELFIKHRPHFMTHLLLGHLSRDNNDPALVKNLFAAHANGVEIAIASRYEPSPVYAIGHAIKKQVSPVVFDRPLQMRMFE